MMIGSVESQIETNIDILDSIILSSDNACYII